MAGRHIIRPCPCGRYGDPTHIVTDDDQEWHPACAIREVYRLRAAIEEHRDTVYGAYVPPAQPNVGDVSPADRALYAAMEKK